MLQRPSILLLIVCLSTTFILSSSVYATNPIDWWDNLWKVRIVDGTLNINTTTYSVNLTVNNNVSSWNNTASSDIDMNGYSIFNALWNNGTNMAADQFCISGDCKSAWPSGLANNSWNETRGNELYYPLVGNPSSFLTAFTELDPVFTALYSYLNGKPNNTYNSTYDAKVSDNSSWTEAVANNLFYRTSNPLGFYNVTNLPIVITLPYGNITAVPKSIPWANITDPTVAFPYANITGIPSPVTTLPWANISSPFTTFPYANITGIPSPVTTLPYGNISGTPAVVTTLPYGNISSIPVNWPYSNVTGVPKSIPWANITDPTVAFPWTNVTGEPSFLEAESDPLWEANYSTISGGSNSTWNESMANKLFYRTSNPLGFYNVTNLPIVTTLPWSNISSPFTTFPYANITGIPSPVTTLPWANISNPFVTFPYANITGIPSPVTTLPMSNISGYAASMPWNNLTGAPEPGWTGNYSKVYFNVSNSSYEWFNNATIFMMYNASYMTSTYNVTYHTGSNATWNESRANSLFAPVWNQSSHNTSWTEVRASQVFAPFWNQSWNNTWTEARGNQIFAPVWNQSGGGNSSWTEARANSLYAQLGAGGNTSWNETMANNLFYRSSNPLGFLNTTYNSSYMTNTYNSTYAAGSNSTWNESMANNLFYRTSNPLGFYNSTNLPRVITLPMSNISGYAASMPWNNLTGTPEPGWQGNYTRFQGYNTLYERAKVLTCANGQYATTINNGTGVCAAISSINSSQLNVPWNTSIFQIGNGSVYNAVANISMNFTYNITQVKEIQTNNLNVSKMSVTTICYNNRTNGATNVCTVNDTWNGTCTIMYRTNTKISMC